MPKHPPLFYVSIHFEEVKREAFFVSVRSKGLSESVKNGMLENQKWSGRRIKEGKQTKRRLIGAKNCSEAKNPRRATSAIKKKEKEEIKKYNRRSTKRAGRKRGGVKF